MACVRTLAVITAFAASVLAQQTPAAQSTAKPAVTATSAAVADDTQPKAPPALSNTPITKQTRMMVIRSLNAEMVFARKALPRGQKGVVIKDGKISPDQGKLAAEIAQFGPAVKPGDRARITDVVIKDKSILFELNGGPKKKKKWYQRVEISGMGGSRPVSDQNPEEINAQGTTVELAFDRFVPEMTGDQVRDLLSPVLDFHAKSAAEAYLETVPPKVKEAIKEHRVLVGMNREMVQYAKGRPEKKVREAADGKTYEEWIYGQPPAEVQFVRFNGDEVVQLKTMTVDGQKLVKTEKEVNVENGTATLAKKIEAEEKRPPNAPTLRRPGEVDNDSPSMKQPPRTSPPKQEEEWGKPKPQPPTTTPPSAPPPGC